MVFIMSITVMMHSEMICPKDTLSTGFVQWKWTIMYGSIFRYPICSIFYKLLGKFELCMFWRQGCRILEWKPVNGIQLFKGVLIWDLVSFTQHKSCFFWTLLMVQYHCSLTLYWWYIVFCCYNHSPRYISMYKVSHTTELKYQVNVIPRKWSRIVWQIVDCWWAVDTF